MERVRQMQRSGEGAEREFFEKSISRMLLVPISLIFFANRNIHESFVRFTLAGFSVQKLILLPVL